MIISRSKKLQIAHCKGTKDGSVRLWFSSVLNVLTTVGWIAVILRHSLSQEDPSTSLLAPSSAPHFLVNL